MSENDERKALKDLVDQSYRRCRLTGTFADDFYHRFLPMSPKISEKFAQVNWESQKRALDHGIRHLILFYFEPSAITSEKMGSVGWRHSKAVLDVEPELYDFFLTALLETVKENDEQFSPELHDAWRTVANHGINVMKSMYD